MFLQDDKHGRRIRTSASHAGLRRYPLRKLDDRTGKTVLIISAALCGKLVVKGSIESVGCLIAKILLGNYIGPSFAINDDLRGTFASDRDDQFITIIDLLHYRVKSVITVGQPPANPEEEVDLGTRRCLVGLDTIHVQILH